jgi:hypothetical protein
MTMESKGRVAANQTGTGEFGQSDVRELRPTDPLGSAADVEALSTRRVTLLDDDRPPESLEGELLEPEEEEPTPSLGTPKVAPRISSHNPPPRPSHNPPHPPEKTSLSPPRPSHAPGSDSEMRVSPPLINMGFDGLQMLLETRLREVNTELSKIAQATGRGLIIRGTLLLLAFAAAGGAIGYFSGTSAEARTRANIREEVMKTYYGGESSPERRKEILSFVEGQLAKSDLGLRLWVDGERRRVDQEIKDTEQETSELASLRSELDKKDAELAELKEELDKAIAAKAKAPKQTAVRSAAPRATAPAASPATPHDEEEAPPAPAPPPAAEPSPEE